MTPRLLFWKVASEALRVPDFYEQHRERFRQSGRMKRDLPPVTLGAKGETGFAGCIRYCHNNIVRNAAMW
jgi:hypothetical protein